MRTETQRKLTWKHFLKRAIDIFGSILSIPFLLPLSVLISILIKIDSPGPVLFRQQRLGRGGKTFLIMKFRTMKEGAEQELNDRLDRDPSMQLTWDQWKKLNHDPRLTRLGRFLRKSSLDEVPQFWNVLRGEMSLVGPRPILANQVQDYGPDFEYYVQAPPGLTGLWQVSGRNLRSFNERVEMDREYLQHWSLSLDFYILLRTVGVVLKGEGAF